MPRKFLKRYLPDPHSLREQWYLRPFQALLHDPALLHPNRRAASRALAIGLFWAFVPIPFQMAPAALMALWMRVNLPIAITTVWVTNPLTMGPIFYAEYRLGAWLLDARAKDFRFELTLDWLTEGLVHIWQPMLLGMLIFSVVSATLGYFLLNWIWKFSVMRSYTARPHFRLHPFRRKPATTDTKNRE